MREVEKTRNTASEELAGGFGLRLLRSFGLRRHVERTPENLLDGWLRTRLIQLRIRLALFLGGRHVERVAREPEITEEMIESAYWILFNYESERSNIEETLTLIHRTMLTAVKDCSP